MYSPLLSLGGIRRLLGFYLFLSGFGLALLIYAKLAMPEYNGTPLYALSTIAIVFVSGLGLILSKYCPGPCLAANITVGTIAVYAMLCNHGDLSYIAWLYHVSIIGVGFAAGRGPALAYGTFVTMLILSMCRYNTGGAVLLSSFAALTTLSVVLWITDRKRLTTENQTLKQDNEIYCQVMRALNGRNK